MRDAGWSRKSPQSDEKCYGEVPVGTESDEKVMKSAMKMCRLGSKVMKKCYGEVPVGAKSDQKVW